MKSRTHQKQRVPVYVYWNSGHVETLWAYSLPEAKKLREKYLKTGKASVEIGVWK